jgi:hypothetical protein
MGWLGDRQRFLIDKGAGAGEASVRALPAREVVRAR